MLMTDIVKHSLNSFMIHIFMIRLHDSFIISDPTIVAVILMIHIFPLY